MNFHGMRYFLAVRDRCSIHTAVTALHLSQLALSEHIKQIDAELNTALLNKTRLVTLNRVGDCFVAMRRAFLRCRQHWSVNSVRLPADGNSC